MDDDEEKDYISIKTLIKVDIWLLIWVVSAGLTFYPIREFLIEDNRTANPIALIIGLVCASIGLYYLLKLEARISEWKEQRKIQAKLKEINH